MTKDRDKLKKWGRWVATFLGFPLAGIAARAAGGTIDSATAAAIGGLAGGAVLGAVQAVIGGIDPGNRIRWTGATAVGLAAGLTIGAGAVGYHTDAASLVVMGAISGAGVGLAQALSIPMRRVDRVLWAAAIPALWAGGWLITSQVIVDAEAQHAVFGASGALAVSVFAGILFAMRGRPTESAADVAGISSDRVAA